MVTREENELLTRLEGDAPMGRLMRDNYWIPFALSAHLVHGDAPMPVRLFGENYVAFRAEDGRVGFLDELCPHRRSSLLLGRIEGNAVRCIYHGWKIDVSGCVVECPNQALRPERFAANVHVDHFPVHEAGGVAWVWLGDADTPPLFPELPFVGDDVHSFWCVSRVPCNWLQGVEGTIDSAHVGVLHHTWLSESAKVEGYGNLGLAINQSPTYETEAAPHGLRAAALRRTDDGRTYVRITEYLMPLVTVVPVGRGRPRDGSMFVFAPVDDTHHLLFYGYFADAPVRPPQELGGAAPDLEPDPSDFAVAAGRSLQPLGSGPRPHGRRARHRLREDPARGGRRGPDEHGTDPRPHQGAPRLQRRGGGAGAPDPARRVARRRDGRAAARQRLDARRCSDAERARGALGRGRTMGRHHA